MDNTLIILVFICAFFGGMGNAWLQYLKQSIRPPFDWPGFIGSIITSLALGAGIAIGFNYSGITSFAIAGLTAFLSGMGINSAASGVHVLLLRKLTTSLIIDRRTPKARFIVGSMHKIIVYLGGRNV